ncbi:MAG: Eco57I restriction-modification methylase domain-containing protein, partial [Novipirellula sp. JB048]
MKNCLAWLSGTAKARSQDPATDAVFAAPDALGWAYQYWNTEEKDRVFETVRTKKGAKIKGADIIPATQLYTEDYMVKFLVQNSLGATWMGMNPDSQLVENWEYYVRDADRGPAKRKPLKQITLLDPACGSGHFLIEAFDMFYAMYEEEGEISEPEDICKSILENNLFGIDIDERAIQIAEASLWMKAEEKAFGFSGANTNLVAATSSHLKGESWERYLAKLEKEPSTVRVLRKFAVEMEHIDELGSLARPAEALESIIKEEHELWEMQERERHEADKSLFKEIRDDVLASQLPFHDITDQKFFERTMQHALFAIDGFTAEARESGEFNDQLMGLEAKTGFRLLDLLSREYDVVVANPPYMGSKNMGSVLKKCVVSHYKAGKRDLYASFMLRSLELAKPLGRAALVTQHSWMFLKSFEELRLCQNDETSATKKNAEFRGLLIESAVETLAHLGTGAFAEISGEVVNSVLFIISNTLPTNDHRIATFRIVQEPGPDEKANSLREAVRNQSNSQLCALPVQRRFRDVPRGVLCYWIVETVGRLSDCGRKVFEIGGVRRGISTGQNDRLLRMTWEHCVENSRWTPFVKAGTYQRWHGLEYYSIDWPRGVTAMRALPGSAIRNSRYFDQYGLTYSQAGNGCLGVRELSADSVFEAKSPGIFIDASADVLAVAAVLNCRVGSWLLRSMSPGIDINEATVSVLPLPQGFATVEQDLLVLAKACIDLKAFLNQFEILERAFDPNEFLNQPVLVSTLIASAYLHCIEGVIDCIVVDSFGLTSEETLSLQSETGVPVGRLPTSTKLTELPHSKVIGLDLSESVRSLISANWTESPLSPSSDLRNSLKARFEAGPGGIVENTESLIDDEGEVDDEDEPIEARIGIPA